MRSIVAATARSGLAALAVAAASMLVLVGCAPGGEPRPSTPISPESGKPVNLVAISVGDCFDVPPSAPDGQALEYSSCDTPHTYEAYAEHELADGEYPGVDELTTIAKTQCRTAFESFTGGDSHRSAFDFSYIGPSESTWNALDDRELVCILFPLNGQPTTGSARDSGA
ncbi:hypothetical protein F8O01_12465 [Pseudoclavibacter chungangensis]|uniref:Septum formation-related domain-containing protein n=1 Tax=Pseudoclavibacter chungangensis TaxID=587635 RepID=A0A7J5BPH4_9MICO|nr:hypothetical protein F8O01_12465 [Pseudoclavibacter chungangensis]